MVQSMRLVAAPVNEAGKTSQRSDGHGLPVDHFMTRAEQTRRPLAPATEAVAVPPNSDSRPRCERSLRLSMADCRLPARHLVLGLRGNAGFRRTQRGNPVRPPRCALPVLGPAPQVPATYAWHPRRSCRVRRGGAPRSLDDEVWLPANARHGSSGPFRCALVANQITVEIRGRWG